MPDIFVAKTREEENIDLKKDKDKKKHLADDSLTPTSMYIDSEPATAFSNFRIKPANVHFEHQQENEHVYLFVRRHHITNLPWLITGLILLIVPFILLALIPLDLLPFRVPANYIFILVIFYYLCIFSYLFVNYLSWFYNISLVTEERVVDIDFSGLLYSDVAVTKLNLIEDVNSIKSGFIRSLFNYGDVFLQTAGEKAHFDFLKIPYPERAADIVQNLIGGDRHV